jgi:glycolate oxidase FAD binding subunit
MSVLHAPDSEEALAEMIRIGGPFAIEGLGSKRGLGRATNEGERLSLARFKGVAAYEPEELILEAGAATSLADVQRLLAQRQQMLAFEPPDHAHLWGAQGKGSLGGLVATGLAGPRRIKAGSVRDHILGVRGVTGRGEVFKAGARVVKNVTGYDMPKLMTGAFGTLAALTSVTFKVLPAPETEETVLVMELDEATAIQVMTQALQSTGEISAAAHVPGQGTYLRFEGIAVSVAARRDRFVSGLQHECEVLNETASRKAWVDIRDCRVLPHDSTRALWRISVPPSEGAATLARISVKIEARHFVDWGGGLLWVSVPAQGDAGAAVIRAAVTHGHAMLYAAPVAVRARIAVFHPQETSVAALTARVKLALDPERKLNPGRMYEGV